MDEAFQVQAKEPVKLIGRGYYGLIEWEGKILDGNLTFTIPGKETQSFKIN